MTAQIDLTQHYKPRWYQEEFEKAMFSGKRRALLVWHRRAGKDIAALNFMVNEMMKKVGIYYYFFPTFKQARSVIWDGIDKDGKRIIDAFPKELIAKKNEVEMKIRLINGSMFQMVGTDNYDSIAGTNPIGCVFSEYSLQDPQVWRLIVSPILNQNNGWAVFVGTPRGKNHQYELDETARENPQTWFYSKLTIDDTKLLSKEDIDRIMNEEGISEETACQEYWCSYDRGQDGTYYGKLLFKAKSEGRIGNVPYEPHVPVSTAWDLGFGDSTSIVFWQNVGAETRIIDFYEANGEQLAHFVKYVQDRPYVYSDHYVPHDAGAATLQTGITTQKMMTELGLKTVLLPRDDIGVGVEAVRVLLSTCYIDSKKCKHLIKCLENYHKKFNDKMNCYSDTPVHDWSSHASDCIRYMAMAKRHFGKGNKSLTPDKILEMRQRNLGY